MKEAISRQQFLKTTALVSAHRQYGHTGPTTSVMAMTSIVNPERTVDGKGKIKVEAEDNAPILMGHSRGVISHVMGGFNYFDPHGITL